jgi:4-aminobutyrate aminotransferase-like enzyme
MCRSAKCNRDDGTGIITRGKRFDFIGGLRGLGAKCAFEVVKDSKTKTPLLK